MPRKNRAFEDIKRGVALEVMEGRNALGIAKGLTEDNLVKLRDADKLSMALFAHLALANEDRRHPDSIREIWDKFTDLYHQANAHDPVKIAKAELRDTIVSAATVFNMMKEPIWRAYRDKLRAFLIEIIAKEEAARIYENSSEIRKSSLKNALNIDVVGV